MSEKELALFSGNSRYKVLRQLGAGGMGVVYEVFDREREHAVALKTHKHRDSNSLYRFKKEFRSLAGISHPNLVTMYDLVVDGDTSFFTMELVEGVDFVTFCSDGAESSPYRFDEERLRLGLSQLAAGVRALHAAGKVHRDLKPSNVLVSRDKRVVILDFGLVTTQKANEDFTEPMEGAGTLAYMAPEQTSHDSELTRAADLYSVGVMLYQALIGRLPFIGSPLEVAQCKQTTDPCPPGELNPNVPGDLNALCLELLSRDAGARPSAEELERRSGVRKSRPTPPSIINAGPLREKLFVGRDTELDLLERHYGRLEEGRFGLALIRGESGMGKSALAREFLDLCYARDESVLILHGRCYERETVPYKAMDSLIDNLSRTWRELESRESTYILPKDADLLIKLFPVLDRVAEVAGAPAKVRGFDDALELRSRGFGALRETFQRLGEIRRLILFLDDLQWIDVDTVNLLLEVTKQPDPPPLLLILASRFAAEMSSPLERLLEQCKDAALTIDLEPLNREEIEAMARELLGGAGGRDLWRFVRESKGSPFFIEQYAEALTREDGDAPLPTLEALLIKRLERLEPEQSALLEVLSLAGEPLDFEIVALAARLEKDEGLKAVRALSVAHFISTAPGQDTERLIPYHDRIRQAVTGSIGAGERRKRHESLARAYEDVHPNAYGEIALHCTGAGNEQKAAVFALHAAGKAEAELSFDRAAKFYRLALSLVDRDPAEERQLWVSLAEALANGGRGAEAAEEYLKAAKGAGERQSLLWREKAAYHLLASGRVDEGVSLLVLVMKERGIKIPKTHGRAIVSALVERFFIKLSNRHLRFEIRDEEAVPASLRELIDACWYAGTGLWGSEQTYGYFFGTRYLRLALSKGTPQQIACALAVEAVSAAVIGESEQKVENLLRRAREVSAISQSNYASVIVESMSGFSYFSEGKWRAALDVIENVLAQHGEFVFEAQLANLLAIHLSDANFWLGRLKAQSARAAANEDIARKQGNNLALLESCIGLNNMRWLVCDDADTAIRKSQEVLKFVSQRDFHLQHLLSQFSTVNLALYQAKGESAGDYCSSVAPSFRKSAFARFHWHRTMFYDGCARAEIGAAAETKELKKHLRRAKFYLKQIEKKPKPPWSTGLAQLIRGQIHGAEGKVEEAVLEFVAARRLFERAEMALHAAAAKCAEGKLMGGDEGAVLMAEVHRYLTEQDVVKHEKFLGIFIPWIIYGAS